MLCNICSLQQDRQEHRRLKVQGKEVKTMQQVVGIIALVILVGLMIKNGGPP